MFSRILFLKILRLFTFFLGRKQAASIITVPKKKARPVAENLALNTSGGNAGASAGTGNDKKSYSTAVMSSLEHHRTSPKKSYENHRGFSAYHRYLICNCYAS